MQGSHGMKNKCLPYERSCGVPLIVRIPWMEQKKLVETPVSAVDFYPTCMELAGGRSKKKLPGESLLGLIEGKHTEHRPVFAENHMTSNPWYMMRNERFKLVVNSERMEPVMLFDLKKDPEEAENIVSDPAFFQVKQELLEEPVSYTHLITWQDEVLYQSTDKIADWSEDDYEIYRQDVANGFTIWNLASKKEIISDSVRYLKSYVLWIGVSLAVGIVLALFYSRKRYVIFQDIVGHSAALEDEKNALQAESCLYELLTLRCV